MERQEPGEEHDHRRPSGAHDPDRERRGVGGIEADAGEQEPAERRLLGGARDAAGSGKLERRAERVRLVMDPVQVPAHATVAGQDDERRRMRDRSGARVAAVLEPGGAREGLDFPGRAADEAPGPGDARTAPRRVNRGLLRPRHRGPLLVGIDAHRHDREALAVPAQVAERPRDPRDLKPAEARAGYVVEGEEDRAAGERLLETIRSYPGEVYVPLHSFYATEAGKQSYAHWASIANVSGVMYTRQPAASGSSDGDRRAIIADEVAQAVASGRFEAIILDEPPKGLEQFYWTELLAPRYVLQKTLFSDATVFWPVTGIRTRPQYIFVRKTP